MNNSPIPISQLPVVKSLLNSSNPSIEYKVRVNLLDESEDSAPIQALRARIGNSQTAIRLLSYRQKDGTIPTHAYRKWQGPFWTLVSLASIDYPSGDTSLYPMRDQVYDWLLAPEHLEFRQSLLIPGQEDRFRRCAGQEAFTVWFTYTLGIADERSDLLAQRLVEWQWPDGGWNCDKRPEASISSLHETFIPVRTLFYYGRIKHDNTALDAARRAAEFMLQRRLFKHRRDGTIIDTGFTQLTFPFFYHYNILPALVIIAEAGLIHDERCQDALELLESKRLADGGFPMERVVYKTADSIITRGTFADWGARGKKQMNEYVTVEALYALKKAGKL